jgi:hypothetical protein
VFDRALQLSWWVLILGGLVSLIVTQNLLDGSALTLLCMILWIGPLVFRYVAVRTKWGASHQAIVSVTFKSAAVTLAIVLGILMGNMLLDHAPTQNVRARVLYKYSHAGKGSFYKLLVGPSWRNGKRHETLDVGSDTYARVNIGDMVIAEVHRGFFGLPWCGRVKVDEVNQLP